MRQKLLSTLGLLFLGLVLSGCGDPTEEFEKVITGQGYIPYKAPLAEAGVGSIVKGDPANMRLAARPQRCFPDNVGRHSTGLRWQQATALPNRYRNVTAGINMDLSPLTRFANPVLALFNFGRVKNVEISFERASVEYLDEIAFEIFYQGMSDLCREYLSDFPFIVQALKVDKMNFTFRDNWGAQMELTPGLLGQLVSIEAGVNWRVERGMTLVIESPKYIGFQVAQLHDDSGRLQFYSNRLDRRGQFVFQDVLRHRNQIRTQSLASSSSQKDLRRPADSFATKLPWGAPGSGEEL